MSGLVAAHDLLQAGFEVILVEALGRPGGMIGTSLVDGYRFEDGQLAIQGESPACRALCEELGLAGRIVHANPAARERFLYYRGCLRRLPRSFKEFLGCELFTPRQKFRALVEPLIRSGHPEREETVAEFFGRRVGRGITMTWVDVVVSGVYAGNPNRLGIRSAFPDIDQMEQESGSIFKAMRQRAKARVGADGSLGASPLWSLDAGLGLLLDTLVRRIGTQLRLGRRLTHLARDTNAGRMIATLEVSVDGVGADAAPSMQETLDVDRVVIATDAPTAGILLGNLAPDAADLLFEVESAPLVVAQLGLDVEQVPGLPMGAGFLVPRCMRMRTLAWSFSSLLFPGTAPDGKLALVGHLGGTLDPHAVEIHEDILRHLMLGELALALGQRTLPEPEVFRIVRWPHAMPQYNVGHLRRVAAVRRLLEVEVPQVLLCGNWTDGIGLDDGVRAGREAAQAVLSGLPHSGAAA
jgi:oxygen-dependent protoporphyrinogen oxidase